MACLFYAAQRWTLVLLALAVPHGIFSIVHGTELIKPSFFFSPLAHCALESRYAHKNEYQTGFHVHVAPFVTKNFSKDLIGAGLGAGETNEFLIGPSAQNSEVNSDHLIAVLRKNATVILQTIDESINRPQAKLNLNPEHQDVGVTIVLRHDLNTFLKGLFYSLEVSLIEQTRKLNPSYKNKLTPRVETSDIITIEDYFNGAPQSIYDPLKTLKLSSEPLNQKGCDFIQATIGYHILDKNDYRFTLLGSLQLPCGPDHSVAHLFAPNIGVRHVNIGIGWNGHIKLAGNNTTSWRLTNIAMGGYNFPKEESRIPGIVDMPWAHYYQTQADKTPQYYTLTPACDVLPQVVKVKQGLSLQDTFMINYQHKQTTIDIGFSAGYREEEHNVLNVPWPTSTYAIANRYLNPFNPTGASNAPTNQTFLVDGKMYPSTTGKLPESLSSQTFTLGVDSSGNPVTMNPVTSGAWAQSMSKKIINTADLALNQPTVFFYQLFASWAHTFNPSATSEITTNIGCNVAFGQPQELMMRTYQIWVGLGGSF